MKTEDEIASRISEIKNELLKIDRAIEKELSLPFFERRNRVAKFLDFQKKLYIGLLQELIWVLNK